MKDMLRLKYDGTFIFPQEVIETDWVCFIPVRAFAAALWAPCCPPPALFAASWDA